MKRVSDEDLLGYTLGALESTELEQIELLVRDDIRVAAKVEQFQESLLPLDGLAPPAKPRTGLARRTCECIAAVPLTAASGESGIAVAASRKRNWFTERRELPGGRGRTSVMDFAIAAGVMMLLAAIVLPALNHSRHHGRVLACQQNLRTVGLALLEYASQHGGMHLPIPRDENLGFAGVVAPMLKDCGLVDEGELFLCAGLGSGDDQSSVIPTLDQLRAARGETLWRLQRQAGRDYAYCLGQQVDGEYTPAKNSSRPWYVILADKPAAGLAGRASANHDNCGQNVFFEDGHTQFLESPIVNGDSIYENDWGTVAPGVNGDDSVVAPSGVRILNLSAMIAD